MMDNNTIFFISKESRGGIEIFLDQTRLLDPKSFKKIYCFYKRDKFTKIKRNCVYLNKDYPEGVSFSLRKVSYFFKNIIKTYKLVKGKRPDLIFACDIYSFLLISSIKMLAFCHIPLVVIINTNAPFIFSIRPGRLYRKLLFLTFKISSKKPDVFVFTSKALSNHAVNKFNIPKHKVIAIPHSVNLAQVRPKSKENLPKEEKRVIKRSKFKIFSVGRLEEQKDFKTILKAFAIIAKKIPRSELFILGDGPQKEELKSLATTLKIKEKVHFFGWRRNVYKYLKHADIFLFSSFYEGFGMTIVEAMALGVPVIATDTSFGPSEILSNGKYGILVPIGDFHKMAYSVVKLFRNAKKRRLYQQFSHRRAKQYDTYKMLKKYESLFLTLLERNNSKPS